MADLDTYSLLTLFLLPPILIILIHKLFTTAHPKDRQTNPRLPNSFPIIGSYLAVRNHSKDRLTWMTAQLQASPTSTVVMLKPLFGGEHIITANPSNVEHILKTKFAVYEKGNVFTTILRDLLGHGIFNVDGEEWKLQRHVASHEFSTKSLRKFVEQVVDTELDHRLVPILAQAADNGMVFDLQDLLQRFAFDNICKIAFGYDSALLLPSLPDSPFADAFETAVAISSKRFRLPESMLWRIKRFLNVGSERQLRKAVSEVRDFAANIVKQKKQQVDDGPNLSSSESDLNPDLLSRFLKSGYSDEQFLTDIVISFILAGRDTTSVALTWFFWLLAKNPAVESEIVNEIKQSDENPEGSAYDYAKELVYTHAALHESMRLYPPVPEDSKQVSADGVDDVWPDGSVVRRGSTVAYHIYAIGRMESIWGEDWAEFRPERWLEEGEEGEGRRKKVFVGKDPYSYPVFQAGPRVCLGKEMALLQMKRMVAGVLRRFRVVPTAAEEFEPVLLPYLTGRMEGGLAVRFERRV